MKLNPQVRRADGLYKSRQTAAIVVSVDMKLFWIWTGSIGYKTFLDPVYANRLYDDYELMRPSKNSLTVKRKFDSVQA